MTKTCSIGDCAKPVLARGWCRTHYTRWYETSSTELGVRTPKPPPLPEPRPLAERFWEKVEKSDGCWIWRGGKTTQGYGMIWSGGSRKVGRNVMAHRVSWELRSGSTIPEGMVIDHLCRVPSCVNPDHLEVVTIATNTERGLAPKVGRTYQTSKTHCPQGHEYTPENTYVYGNSRMCRTCAITRTQARRQAARV